MNDRDINCINHYKEDIDMRIINGGSTSDNQAIVISATLISNELSNSIICEEIDFEEGVPIKEG